MKGGGAGRILWIIESYPLDDNIMKVVQSMVYKKEDFYKIEKEFIDIFNRNWSDFLNSLFFQQQQFISGNRLRPLIVLVGYLATKQDLHIDSKEYEKISRLSLSIELIHKASLILDDLIDEDPARHGKKAFHIEYGTENTMMFAINLLSISVDHLNQMIHETPEFITLQEKGIKLLTKTMYDMSLGELKELNIDIGTLYDSQLAKEIIDLETSPLIANSLLLGYFAGNGNNYNEEKTFSEIGYDSGYIFQVMNDLEPFCQQNKLREHKGRLNTDIGQSKKNIAVSLLYSLLSIQEKDRLKNAADTEEETKLLIQYFNLYHIKSSFIREVDFIHQNIKERISCLPQYGISEHWCTLFTYFIEKIVLECKSRLT